MKLRSWYASVFAWFSRERKRQREEDLRRELEAHLELESEEQRVAGVSPEEASYAARRAFGNATRVMEDTRTAWGWAPLEQLAQDAGFAFRTLRKNLGYIPTFVAVAVLLAGVALLSCFVPAYRATRVEPLEVLRDE